MKQRDQIIMSESEVLDFLDRQRNASVGSINVDGSIHLVGMWYAVLDGEIWFETKVKSQKVVNLRRDDRVSFLVEAGTTYDKLRGVSIEGHASVIDDPEQLWQVGVAVFERYNAPYAEELKPFVEAMIMKRVCVRIRPVRRRSWDHRKLGLPDIELGGSTAKFIDEQ
jgi:PPOX class probable F420-dependent enzyme